MTFDQIDEFIRNLDDTIQVDESFGDGIMAYRLGESTALTLAPLMAVVYRQAHPLKVSLRCDPLLAKKLRAEYETVLPGENLSRRHWNTILCTGQLPDDEIYDLARLSYHISQK